MVDKTPSEMIAILPEKQREQAQVFVTLAERLQCKTSVRYAKAHKTWKCLVTRKKPQRVLYTIECTEEHWHIKACLWNIDTYREVLDRCSEDIKTIIRSGYDCKQCNMHCSGGAAFTFEGIAYRKCVGNCFYFSNISESDWAQVLLLIEEEHMATNPKI